MQVLSIVDSFFKLKEITNLDQVQVNSDKCCMREDVQDFRAARVA